VADWTVVVPPALTENDTSTLPEAPAMRASGGTTGRRPLVRSGTPGSRVTSRMAETPFSGTGAGGGAVITSTAGAAGVPAGGAEAAAEGLEGGAALCGADGAADGGAAAGAVG